MPNSTITAVLSPPRRSWFSEPAATFHREAIIRVLFKYWMKTRLTAGLARQ
ncbi:MAG: hypothetical protein QF493_04825 [Rhodospirillales bacterium]|nr:hypothetical protein [Rhodospirillales bacterium]